MSARLLTAAALVLACESETRVDCRGYSPDACLDEPACRWNGLDPATGAQGECLNLCGEDRYPECDEEEQCKSESYFDPDQLETAIPYALLCVPNS